LIGGNPAILGIKVNMPNMPTSRPISWFLEQDDGGCVRFFDMEYERDFIWAGDQMSALISSILAGNNIGAIRVNYRQEGNDDVYKLVDGFQRLCTCYSYTVGRWKVDGRSFADLSRGEQEQFLEYQIPVLEYQIPRHEIRISDDDVWIRISP
jgi:uncharacterized protein with ParB-like and HNH nuclease domain